MSIFDNATQVMIGNKEVQSIITSNGGVLYEKQSGDNYLLTLTSDKDILSYYDNDSALLTATLTNNGVGVQGEMVRFDGFLLDTPITRSITQNTETHVGSKYILSNIPITNLNKIFLNKEHTVYITKDAVDGVKIYWPNGGSGDETSNISVENGIITYSRGGTTYTEDCSSYDMSVVYSQVSGFSINDYGVFAVTDSRGVATVSYESKGTGDLNIKACVPERMLVTEIYIEDIYYNNPTEYIRTTEYTTERYVPLSNPVTFTNNDWEASFDLSAMAACGFGIFDNSQYVVKNYVLIGGSGGAGYRYAWWGVEESHESDYNFGGPSTSYFNYKIVKQGTTLELYENGTLKKTVTGITFLDGITHEIGWVEWKSGKTVKIKNVQIRVS